MSRRTKRSDDPMSATWQELAPTVPKKEWHAFKQLVLDADIAGEPKPKGLVARYPDHPVVQLVKRFLETGDRRAMTKALEAVAGTDDEYHLVLMKS